MNDEYLGHSDDRVKYSARYIGVPTAGMEPYFSATPNIIIKYNPSMLFNHDFYFPGSAYMSSEPQRYSEYGGFTSLDGPDSAFRMPRNARPMSCSWVASSNVEPYYGRRDMDIVEIKQRMPKGGWEYITYPRLTAQSNNVGHADFTTWGSGTCEIYRFYQPQLTDMTYMGNNSNYTAIRNFYCPNLTSMNTSFSIVDWGSATPTPHIGHNILELENFYAPNVKQASGTWADYSASTITSMKNVEVGSALALSLQQFDYHDRLSNRNAKRYITNYTGHQDSPSTWPKGISGDTNLMALQAYDRRMVLNGDIVLDAHFSSTAYFTAYVFQSCDIGTLSATNIYFGPKNKAIYENNAISASACYTAESNRGGKCTFGSYPIKYYTQFPPQ